MRLDEVIWGFFFFKKIGLCSECGPQTSSISITWHLVRKANSQPTESETQRLGHSNMCFKKPCRWFWCRWKLANHLSWGAWVWIEKKSSPTAVWEHSQSLQVGEIVLNIPFSIVRTLVPTNISPILLIK